MVSFMAGFWFLWTKTWLISHGTFSFVGAPRNWHCRGSLLAVLVVVKHSQIHLRSKRRRTWRGPVRNYKLKTNLCLMQAKLGKKEKEKETQRTKTVTVSVFKKLSVQTWIFGWLLPVAAHHCVNSMMRWGVTQSPIASQWKSLQSDQSLIKSKFCWFYRACCFVLCLSELIGSIVLFCEDPHMILPRASRVFEETKYHSFFLLTFPWLNGWAVNGNSYHKSKGRKNGNHYFFFLLSKKSSDAEQRGNIVHGRH